MRYGANQELQRCEVRTPEFALPVQLDCCVGFRGGQFAIDLGQEGTSTARDKLIRCGIFSWMAANDKDSPLIGRQIAGACKINHQLAWHRSASGRRRGFLLSPRW